MPTVTCTPVWEAADSSTGGVDGRAGMIRGCRVDDTLTGILGKTTRPLLDERGGCGAGRQL